MAHALTALMPLAVILVLALAPPTSAEAESGARKLLTSGPPPSNTVFIIPTKNKAKVEQFANAQKFSLISINTAGSLLGNSDAGDVVGASNSNGDITQSGGRKLLTGRLPPPSSTIIIVPTKNKSKVEQYANAQKISLVSINTAVSGVGDSSAGDQVIAQNSNGDTTQSGGRKLLTTTPPPPPPSNTIIIIPTKNKSKVEQYANAQKISLISINTAGSLLGDSSAGDQVIAQNSNGDTTQSGGRKLLTTTPPPPPPSNTIFIIPTKNKAKVEQYANAQKISLVSINIAASGVGDSSAGDQVIAQNSNGDTTQSGGRKLLTTTPPPPPPSNTIFIIPTKNKSKVEQYANAQKISLISINTAGSLLGNSNAGDGVGAANSNGDTTQLGG